MANSWELDANTIDFDDLKLGMRNNTYAQCPECLKYLIWDKIPHENNLDGNMKSFGEHHALMILMVEGYVCPACGADISF